MNFKVNSLAKVFFIPFNPQGEKPEDEIKKTKKILQIAGLKNYISEKKIAAIKQHFGEKGNTNYVGPHITKEIVNIIKENNGKPLLVETNTLYFGSRSNTYDHLMTAYEHGFNFENVGAPLAILDGVNGQNASHKIKIPGIHFKEVHMVSDLLFFDSIITISHVKGHMMSGMGAAIKNLAMGFAGRSGKLAQHADFKPQFVEANCVRCELCLKFCPEKALHLEARGAPKLNRKKCIGCGECLTVCRTQAIEFEWGEDTQLFYEKIAEYAFGAVINHPGKTFFLNVFTKIAKQCDCYGAHNPPVFPDIGLFASTDPVAIDCACMDMAFKLFGKDIFKELWPSLDAKAQIKHAEKIGLGTTKYELIKIE